MAKKVSRMLLNEAKDGMTDNEFFTSRTMITHFEKIIEGICKAYKRKIRIFVINKGDAVAYTDGDAITVNLNCDWIKNQERRVDKYYIIVGVILHECGHILYTDFPLNLRAFEALNCNKLFPKIEISDILEDFFKDNWGSRFQKIYRSIDNCVEDGHIERRVVKYAPGYGECLMKVRQLQLAESGTYTYEEALEDAAKTGEQIDRISALMNLVLIYAKFGIENTGDIEDDLTAVFEEMKAHIDAAVKTNNAATRKSEVNYIFDILIQFIADEIKKEEPTPPKSEEKEESKDDEDESKEESEDEKSDDESGESDDSDEDKSKDSDESSDDSEDNPEDSSKNKDSENPSENKDESEDESESSSEESSSSEEDKESSKESATSDEGEEASEDTAGADEGDDGSSESEKMSKEDVKKAMEDALSGLEKMCEEMSDKTDHDHMDSHPVSEADEEDSDSETEEDLFSKEGLDVAPEGEAGPEDWDLSYLEDMAAEEEVAKDIKKKISKQMKKVADDTRSGRIDKFPSIERYAEPDRTAEEMYEAEHEELDRIARRVVKNLDKVIKERQKGDKLNGLYVGRTLDTAHAYRKDKKIFANKILPEDVPDMEVCVLVDCSGSMSYGTRMEQSRKCAYITWKFCQMMNVPCSVYGHTTDWPNEKHVLMTCVAHPDNIDKNDGKRIFMLRPEANNRDGWAVNFCAEALSKSKATSKLLLIISDGIPAAAGYGYVLGKKDCQEVVARYKKKGISVVTAGIDDCAEDIKGVYLDGVSSKESAKFLDYSDMTQLPKAFATLIKKELL